MLEGWRDGSSKRFMELKDVPLPEGVGQQKKLILTFVN